MEAVKHFKEDILENDIKAWEEDVRALRTANLNEIPVFEKTLIATIIEKIIIHLMEKISLAVPVEKEQSDSDISGIIELDVTGRDNVKGSVMVSFNSDFILNMASTMFGENMQKINNAVEDMVTEFTGLISHRIKSEINENPFEPFISATPITTIVGNAHKIVCHRGKTFLHTNYNGFSINIKLED